MGGTKREQSRRRRKFDYVWSSEAWEKDEKCVRQLDSGDDLCCLVLRQRKRVLVD
jgi:hypothetical protein